MASYLLAAVDLERTWLHHHALQNTSLRCRRFPFHDLNGHLKILDLLAAAIPYILPPPMLSSPTLWYPDFSYSNLLVAKEDPVEIEGLVYWQHSVVSPYWMQAQFPSLFVYDGGLIDLPRGAAVPRLPDHVSTLSPEEQEIYRIHLKFAFRHNAYELRMMAENKRRLLACSMPFGPKLANAPYQVLRSWSDSLVPLCQRLLDFRDVWDAGTPCPIRFTHEEVQNHELEYERYDTYQTSIEALDADLGGRRVGLRSRIPRALGKLKEREATWDDEVKGGLFPYKDGLFSFFHDQDVERLEGVLPVYIMNSYEDELAHCIDTLTLAVDTGVFIYLEYVLATK